MPHAQHSNFKTFEPRWQVKQIFTIQENLEMHMQSECELFGATAVSYKNISIPEQDKRINVKIQIVFEYLYLPTFAFVHRREN
jgi:hypothetical protein